MKDDVHPTYNKEATITCACGNEMTVGSTAEDMEVEICSQCHPFYTGVEKVVDTAGRVEKFKQRQKQAQDQQESDDESDESDEDTQGDEEGTEDDNDDFEDVKEKISEEEQKKDEDEN